MILKLLTTIAYYSKLRIGRVRTDMLGDDLLSLCMCVVVLFHLAFRCIILAKYRPYHLLLKSTFTFSIRAAICSYDFHSRN